MRCDDDEFVDSPCSRAAQVIVAIIMSGPVDYKRDLKEGSGGV